MTAMKKTIGSTIAAIMLTTACSASDDVTKRDDVDLSTPEGAVIASRKIQCSMTDEKPVFYTWEGYALSRRMGEPDKRLFKVNGMNVRQCTTVTDPVRGTGYKYVSREIMLYLDNETGEPLDMWENPWTGDSVKVLHVENDPVNMRGPSYPYDAEGKPSARFFGRVQNDRWFMTSPVPLFYHNVLAGEYQKYVGGVYHATELFNFMGDVESLTGDTDTAEAQVGWVRISNWLPWMEMQGREGIIYFQAAGQKLNGYDELPQVMKDYIEEHAPIYKQPPPMDDDRENETSWTYFKKKLKGGKLPRGGAN